MTLADNLPPEGRELYGEYSKAFRKALEDGQHLF